MPVRQVASYYHPSKTWLISCKKSNGSLFSAIIGVCLTEEDNNVTTFH